MEQNMQLYFKKLASIFTRPNLASFLESIQPDIQELQNFHFYFSNPIFGLLILTAFLILAKSWGLKKAFSYCLVVSSILYLTTKIIIHTSLPIEGSMVTYADIIKLIAIFMITLISIYYFLIRNK
jgi:hypothetical protein